MGAPGATADETIKVPGEMWRSAVSMLQSGNPDAAIPILDRLVTLVPDAASVRLELGLALFLVNNDERAGYHIRQALAGDLSEAERRGAQTLLRRIAARRTWSASFAVSVVPQSNAGRRTTQETVMIGGLPFQLAQTAQPEIGFASSGRLTYEPHLGGNLWGRATVGFSGTFYQRSALNDYSMDVELGLSRRSDDGRDVGAGILARQRWVGNARYWHEAGVYISGATRPNDTTRLLLRVDLLKRKARDRPGLDGTVTRLVIGAEHALSPRLAMFGHGQATLVNAADAHQSGRTFGVGMGATLLAQRGWRTTLQANLRRDHRDGPAPFFGIIRRDTDLSVSARVLNRDIQWRGFAPALEVGHERRISNIPIQRYRNTFVSMGLERAF